MASIEKHDNKSIIIAYIFLIWGHALNNSYYFFVLIEQLYFGFLVDFKKFKRIIVFF